MSFTISFYLACLTKRSGHDSRQDSISDDKRVFIVCLLGTFVCFHSSLDILWVSYYTTNYLFCVVKRIQKLYFYYSVVILDLPTACFVCTRESQTVDARNILVPTKYNYMKSFLYLTFRPVCVHGYNIFLQSFSLLPTC